MAGGVSFHFVSIGVDSQTTGKWDSRWSWAGFSLNTPAPSQTGAVDGTEMRFVSGSAAFWTSLKLQNSKLGLE
jgi:hypothetical protein